MAGFGISSVATSVSATERQVWFLPINSLVHVPRTAESVKTTSTGYCFIFFFIFNFFVFLSVFLFHSFVTYSKEITVKADPWAYCLHVQAAHKIHYLVRRVCVCACECVRELWLLTTNHRHLFMNTRFRHVLCHAKLNYIHIRSVANQRTH